MSGARLRLDAAQRFDWLRLSRCEGVGPRTFQGLINRFGGARAALEALPHLAAQRGRKIVVPDLETIDAEMRHAERLGARFIGFGEGDYPERLREIEGAPPMIAVLGRVELLARPSVAIVGSRNASAGGRKMAGQLAAGLNDAGYVVVSGLARGIDTEAHRASLKGGTIAVMAGGLDRPYPPENAALFDTIAAQGAVISEMPFGQAPRGKDFPRRNRLISGLALGTIVIEAAMRSGSLVTARFANEQGREVFAVPGSPYDPRCEGTNNLLREGAGIVTTLEDVLNVLRPIAGEAPRAPILFRDRRTKPVDAEFEDWFADEGEAIDAGDDESASAFIDDAPADSPSSEDESTQTRLLALLSVSPVDLDTLARMSGASLREVQSCLSELEMLGRIARHAGNRVALSEQ